MVVHLQSNRGTLRNVLDDEVMLLQLTNNHAIEENRYQTMSIERLHQQQNVSTQFRV